MPKVTINEMRCKGCSLCVSVCPKKILEISKDTLNTAGYYPSCMTDMSRCIGCAMCAVMCPDCAIVVED